MKHPYSGSTAIFPTKHGKERAVSKSFVELLDIDIKVVEIDTDVLGTFTGEVERTGTPLETAIAKTELAREYGNLLIASEGTIGPDPSNPFLISDIELVILRDVERDIVIREMYRSFEIKAHRIEVYPGNDLGEFLTKADFPHHALIAKGNSFESTQPIKGIKDKKTLERAIETIAKSSPVVIVENDLRADQSPSRMANIEIAARKLALRVRELCPACATPGFGQVDVIRGVYCSECKELNPDAPHRQLLGCVMCAEKREGAVIQQELPAERCIFCNP